MNFFERQRQVRRLSTRLVLLFLVAVVGIIAAVDLVVVVAFGYTDADPAQLAATIAFASVATAAAIALAALIRTMSLRGGGGQVARSLGGELVPPDTTDPELRRLRNVVEEMAIAAGVPVPEVYVLRGEQAINAFAAGWSTSDAAVAVTQGALDQLDRDELQGVIGHEFSHVVNGDMRLNIRLIGLLFGILFLTVIGRTLLYSSRGRDRNNPLPLVGIGLLAAGGVGVLVGRIIQASVSRQREYLADASAVQYTRQTAGLAGALKKIGGLQSGSKLRNPRRDEVGHMLFGSGTGRSSLFATHPPLIDRIRKLEPDFDPDELTRPPRQRADAPPSGSAADTARGLAGGGRTDPAPGSAAPSGLPDVGRRAPIDASAVVARVASLPDPTPRNGGSLIDHIPSALLDRARRSDTVVPLVLGLLMADDPQARAAQHAGLARDHGRPLADATLAEAQQLAGLHPMLRLPLAELAMPALRARPEAERQDILVAVSSLIHADNTLTVSEYCLARLTYRALHESMQPRPPRGYGRRTLAAHHDQVYTLLALLAAVGTADPAAAAAAFAAGVAQVSGERSVPYAPPAQGVVALEPGWDVLDALRPEDKSRLVAALVMVIADDGMMTVAESELLRTVCALLHCPLPPLAAPAHH